jgi:hypothetical protein
MLPPSSLGALRFLWLLMAGAVTGDRAEVQFSGAKVGASQMLSWESYQAIKSFDWQV